MEVTVGLNDLVRTAKHYFSVDEIPKSAVIFRESCNVLNILYQVQTAGENLDEAMRLGDGGLLVVAQ